LKYVVGIIIVFCFLLGGLQSQAQFTPFLFWKARNLFVWMGGASVQMVSGAYGTKGTGSTANLPGARRQSSYWTDASGNYWVFGGSGYDVNGDFNYLNDLWRYTPADGKWTWMNGSNTSYQGNVYGTWTVPAAGNTPGARNNAYSWIDGSGKLWLFGGQGLDNASGVRNLADLWKYDPATNMWVIVAGTANGDSWGVFGTQGTGSTSNFPSGRQAGWGGMDSAGNFWVLGGWGKDGVGNTGRLNSFFRYEPANGKWTWMSGTINASTSGVYGTKGVGSTANTPGARSDFMGWTDSSGGIWIFGGGGFDSVGGNDMLNDLWKFTIADNKWTWVSGSNTIDVVGTYGALGTPSTGNSPGARGATATVKDSAGNFWLFGGSGYAASGGLGRLNDLWRFNPGTSEWTWMTGANTTGQIGAGYPGARENSTAFKDASGNVLFFGGYGPDTTGALGFFNDLWKFNPTGSTWTAVGTGMSTLAHAAHYGTKGTGSTANNPGSRHGQQSWYDGAGGFYLLGGEGIDSAGAKGLMNDLWKFTPSDGRWTWVSGVNTQDASAAYGTLGAGSTSNKPGCRFYGATWSDGAGTLWIFGGTGKDGSAGYGYLSDLWKFTPADNKWYWMSGPNTHDQSAAYGTKGTPSTSNIPGPRDKAVSWYDSTGYLWLFGGLAKDSTGTADYANDLWRYKISTGEWTWMTGSNVRNAGGTFGASGVGNTAYTPGARNGAVSWMDPAGAMWVFGGLGYDSAATGGFLNDLWRYTPSDGKWAWMSGTSTGNASGTYGTLGTGSIANAPGARQYAIGWSDGAGNLWISGGYGWDSTGNLNLLNDVWKYTPADGKWTWISGSNTISPNGTYGTLGFAAQSSVPGGRQQGNAWNDGRGSTWIFGGYGLDSVGHNGYMNDLWKFSQ
jgi:N-acetylneuraminic acid mutarotase